MLTVYRTSAEGSLMREVYYFYWPRYGQYGLSSGAGQHRGINTETHGQCGARHQAVTTVYNSRLCCAVF